MRKILHRFDMDTPWGPSPATMSLVGGPSKRHLDAYRFELAVPAHGIALEAATPDEATRLVRHELDERSVTAWEPVLYATVSIPGSDDQTRRSGYMTGTTTSLRAKQGNPLPGSLPVNGQVASLCIEYQCYERGRTPSGHWTYRCAGTDVRCTDPGCGVRVGNEAPIILSEQHFRDLMPRITRAAYVLADTPANRKTLDDAIAKVADLSRRALEVFAGSMQHEAIGTGGGVPLLLDDGTVVEP